MKQRILIDSDYLFPVEVPAAGVRDSSNPITACEALHPSVLIPEACLQKRITVLADELANDKQESGIDFLAVLNGSCIFAADLSRELFRKYRISVNLHFIKLSAYGNGRKEEGETDRRIKLIMTPPEIEGRDIIVVEDIIDQGFTLAWMLDYLSIVRTVNSIRICTLLNKKLDNPSAAVSELRKKIKPDYTGFFIPDVWAGGYGLDIEGAMRNTPFIFEQKKM